ncbi:MAG: hypothetical protein II592_01950 [Muribaculaceae bacterium]|nr:hypothetical protein [Muribaculaceae bacterium]MBQ4138290.1 hypothetical protein [Muribaculaceae bacterium]
MNTNGKTQNRMTRDSEFLDIYHEALQMMLASGVTNPRRAAIRCALQQGKPRYTVSFDRAYPVVCTILNKGSVPVKTALKRAFWQELADKVAQVRQLAPVSIATALDFVLRHGHPSSYFIDEDYAYWNTYRASRERRARRLKQMRVA